MQKVISQRLWAEVARHGRKAARRQLAIAYVTKELIRLERGDILVTDASMGSIRSGETDARLLRRLDRRGVAIYSCEGLHANAGILGSVAFLGSANLSASSETRLIEAGLLTDAPSVVSSVASFIEQLRDKSERLSKSGLAALCEVEVVRRGRAPAATRRKPRLRIRPLGRATWLVGVRELVKDPPSAERRLIERMAEELGQEAEDLEWIRWGSKSTFARQCREGDLLIQLWRPSSGKGWPTVYRMTPVLRRQPTKNWTRLYLGDPVGRGLDEITWGQFKRLLKSVGNARAVRPGSVQLLDDETADAITRAWPRTQK